jgi:hypothetical protein
MHKINSLILILAAESFIIKDFKTYFLLINVDFIIKKCLFYSAKENISNFVSLIVSCIFIIKTFINVLITVIMRFYHFP